MPKGGILSVTGRTKLAIAEDRIHATVTSGVLVETFAFKLHEAEIMALEVLDLIAEHRVARSAKVVRLPRKGPPLPHG